MPFEKFEVKTTPSAKDGTGAKATLSKRKGAAMLSIVLTPSTAAGLGWAKGDMLDVLMGEGGDHGLIRMRKNRSTGTAEVKECKSGLGGPYIKISLGHVPHFVDRKEAARHINFEELETGSGKWVEFVMPSWADETRPRAKPGVTIPAKVGAHGPLGHRTTDVAPALMGDPPPGRRERVAAIG